MRSDRRRRQGRAAAAVNPSGRAKIRKCPAPAGLFRICAQEPAGFPVEPALAFPDTASAALCSVSNPQRSFGCACGSLGRNSPQLPHLARPHDGPAANPAGWGSNLRPSQGGSTRAPQARSARQPSPRRAPCEATADGGPSAIAGAVNPSGRAKQVSFTSPRTWAGPVVPDTGHSVNRRNVWLRHGNVDGRNPASIPTAPSQ